MTKKTCRVLVVDDDRPMAEAVKIVLETRGFRVWQAYDGQKALEIVAKKSPDLVVMDVEMPGVSGLDVCRHIKSRPETKHIKVVILSARSLRPDRDKADDAGADAYLAKPIELDKILDTVNRLLFPALNARPNNKPRGETS